MNDDKLKNFKYSSFEDFDVLKYPFSDEISRKDQMSMAFLGLITMLAMSQAKLLNPNISDENAATAQREIDFVNNQIERVVKYNATLTE